MRGLERVQYRALRIALGLMGSKPNNCLGFLSGIPLLAERFAYLNFRYIVADFCGFGHLLRERLGVLGALKIGRCVGGYSEYSSLDKVPSESFTRHELPALLGTPLVDGQMERKLANVQEAMYSLVAPRELLTMTSGYVPSCILYTNGSLIEGCAGLDIRSKVLLVISLLSLALFSLHYGTLLRLYSLRRDLLFSLIA
jgi:hypothetical protein